MGWIIGKGIGIPFRMGGAGLGSSYWATHDCSNVVATVTSDTTITVAWTDGTQAPDGYRVYVNDVENQTVAHGVGTANITGLTAGTTYEIKVVGYKGINEGTGDSDTTTISTLLSNLVFSLKWDGTQFINAVTGLAMVDHGSVAAGEPIVTNSAIPAVFATAESKYLSTPDTSALSVGDIDFTVALWCKITDISLQQVLAGQYLSTGDQRSWNIQLGSGGSASKFLFAVSSDGTSTGYNCVYDTTVRSNNTAYFVLAWHDATANTINIQVNNGTVYSVAHTTGVKDSSGDLTVGAMANPLLYAGGLVGNVDVWKRKLTDPEIALLWGRGTGTKHPFDSVLSKIILMGDKSGGEDAAISQAVNTVLMAQNPHIIIGTGDYDGVTLTTDQLCTNLNKGMFAAPGNHDDWVVGTRTGFNAWFSGGGYQKVSIPFVDFFLYDYYLKMDESGYYTLSEAHAITLAARQASTQGQWLISGLAASTAKWKVVVWHNPAWASPSDFATPDILVLATNMQWDWSALGADLIVNGHFHFYERLLVNTGSGNVPILVIGNTGTTDHLGRTSEHEDSLAFFNELTDTDFEGGMLVEMNVTEDALTIDLSAIKSDYSVVTGKDQLVLT